MDVLRKYALEYKQIEEKILDLTHVEPLLTQQQQRIVKMHETLASYKRELDTLTLAHAETNKKITNLKSLSVNFIIASVLGNRKEKLAQAERELSIICSALQVAEDTYNKFKCNVDDANKQLQLLENSMTLLQQSKQALSRLLQNVFEGANPLINDPDEISAKQLASFLAAEMQVLKESFHHNKTIVYYLSNAYSSIKEIQHLLWEDLDSDSHHMVDHGSLNDVRNAEKLEKMRTMGSVITSNIQSALQVTATSHQTAPLQATINIPTIIANDSLFIEFLDQHVGNDMFSSASSNQAKDKVHQDLETCNNQLFTVITNKSIEMAKIEDSFAQLKAKHTEAVSNLMKIRLKLLQEQVTRVDK